LYGLICNSYSSGRGFAADFLQIPPHDGHPCLKLMVATANPIADFHCQAITLENVILEAVSDETT